MEAPKDKASNSARVYSLAEYREKKEAPLQAAKERHPAYKAAKRREEEKNEES